MKTFYEYAMQFIYYQQSAFFDDFGMNGIKYSYNKCHNIFRIKIV